MISFVIFLKNFNEQFCLYIFFELMNCIHVVQALRLPKQFAAKVKTQFCSRVLFQVMARVFAVTLIFLLCIFVDYIFSHDDI